MTHHPGWLIQRYDTVASTMDVAGQLARFGARDRSAVVAAEQTAGRGRGGRRWHAPAGSGVFATLILRPPVAAGRLSTLPLIAGVAVAEAIERMAGHPVLLKWPNDVWLGGGDEPLKAAGVLVTSSLRGDGADYVLVGIGINVLDVTPPLPPGATSIQAATGVSVTPDEVFRCVLERFTGAYAAYLASNGRPSLSGWLSRAALLGEEVKIEEAGRSRTGRFVGVDEDGALLIEDALQQISRVVAGDLVRGPYSTGRPE